eukprot:15459110-Heterocapsa_arctica.AAC.1
MVGNVWKDLSDLVVKGVYPQLICGFVSYEKLEYFCRLPSRPPSSEAASRNWWPSVDETRSSSEALIHEVSAILRRPHTSTEAPSRSGVGGPG